MRRLSLLKLTIALLLALIVLFWGGLLSFVDKVSALPDADERETDGIVVLTGGNARLATALKLLEQNKAKRLLVSGVAPGTTKQAVAQALAPSLPGSDLAPILECCTDLGFEAIDTAGNALEAASWAQDYRYTTLRLVTANYHMPRALVEFRRRLPEARITAHPVRSDYVRVEGWWQRRAALVFLGLEYSKYLAALIRGRLDGSLQGPLPDYAPLPAQSLPLRQTDED